MIHKKEEFLKRGFNKLLLFYQRMQSNNVAVWNYNISKTEIKVRVLELVIFNSAAATHPVFLDGHISEVHKHVVQLTGAGCVLHRAEPAEPQLVP